MSDVKLVGTLLPSEAGSVERSLTRKELVQHLGPDQSE